MRRTLISRRQSPLFLAVTLPILLSLAESGCAYTAGDAANLPDNSKDSGILLRSVHIPSVGPAPWIDPALRVPVMSDDSLEQFGHFLVHYDGEASSMRSYLEAQGIQIDSYLPLNTFLVTTSAKMLESVQRQSLELGILRIEPYHPAYKISPEVAQLEASEEMIGLVIHVFRGTDVAVFQQYLTLLGLQVSGIGQGQFDRVALRMPAEQLTLLRDDMARRPEVFWLELRGEVRLLNDQAVPIVQSGSVGGGLALSNEGLHGENQIVGYIDTGADFDSCYFRDENGLEPVVNTDGGTAVDPNHRKILAYDMLWNADDPDNASDYDSHGHGTHVGGNIGGDNLESPIEHDSMDGVATAAKFVVQDGGYAVDNCSDLPALGCPVVDLKPFFSQAYQQGARIHTNSWGDNENGVVTNNYSAGSEDTDTFTYEHPDFLLLYAAGNEGPSGQTVGSPSTAKNCLSVGGTLNGEAANTVASFSSRGPTTDGRIKPDIMAPAVNTSAGSDFNVTSDNCDTNSGSGTSYASPLVAGAAALVRQYFQNGYYPGGVSGSGPSLTPTAALMKAVLINSGVSLSFTTSIPSNDQGWGRTSLDSVLPFPGDPEKIKVIDATKKFAQSGETPYTMTVAVTNNSVPVKVTLVWTDPPSNPAADINLINDLNLTVNDGRRTYRGNVFRMGRSVTGGTADNRNNVETVLVEGPRTGTWTISVSPKKIVSGPQDFALIVRGAIQ